MHLHLHLVDVPLVEQACETGLGYEDARCEELRLELLVSQVTFLPPLEQLIESTPSTSSNR
jgi:hypothetical protein